MKYAKTILKVVGLLAVLLIVLLIALTIVIQTGWFQKKLKGEAKRYLTETLQTRLEIDSVGFSLLHGDICLYGLDIDDRQQRRMFEMDALEVHADLIPLLRHRVSVSSIEINGLKANLIKERPDTAANYQFVLDAFKAHPTPSQKEGQIKEKQKKGGKPIALNLDRLSISDLDVRFNDKRYKLEGLDLRDVEYNEATDIKDLTRLNARLTLRGVETAWVSQTKKGPVDNFLRIDEIKAKLPEVNIKGLHFSNDNRLPRKNSGKPKRGWFDAGHMNLVSDLDLTLSHIGKDSIVVSLDRCVAKDTLTGIDARDIHLKAKVVGRELHLSNIAVQQIATTINIDTAYMRLPDKAHGDSTLYYSTSVIRGRTQLRDISRPFAPVLSGFTMPLNLRARMNGDGDGMQFSDVSVFTDDKALTVAASGHIKGLKDKYELNVHFDVKRMTAKGGIKEKIISQFPVKKFMMKQLHRLGTIGYTGSFDVLWKKEQFQGILSTSAGNMNFFFQLDELTKYVSGKASSKALNIGRVMDLPDIGPVSATANFRIDISKPRTAKMRRAKGGKLPIGHVDAVVERASYKFVSMTGIHVNIDSDGAIAQGDLNVPGKFADISCDFSFANTDAMQKMKIKPKMKIHGIKKLSDEEKALRQAEKAKKKEEKAAAKAQRKAEKSAAKAAKKAEKEAAKAASSQSASS